MQGHPPRFTGNAPVILLFLKAPRPGSVKTRLARGIGEEAACRVYRSLAERQIQRLPGDWPFLVMFTPGNAGDEVRDWLGEGILLEPQSGEELGARLREATRAAFSRGAGSVVLIGGDCPDLGLEDFEICLTRLREGNDAVIGPATDGGYYLLALSRFDPRVFDRIPWSTPDVLQATLERLQTSGFRTSLLVEKEDVDDLASLDRAIGRGILELPGAEVSA